MTTDPADREEIGDYHLLREIDPEVPTADAAEQARELLPHGDDDLAGGLAPDVPEADAAEQARLVETPEEDDPR
ncbi:hypothetical protein OG689_34125 [Kitasatospora sp. NBC_00240]|uniref:hypothetical protein n=1 Tax=Kitasatospora sp. NBC_00240 TaxID=2903567 RepID=UPI002251C25B|nr:hypothetical protein [Kitasatospora sp. NBC_00240]MCX5214244.1 hypothetical protein [Kitasatospora sp. NBC_00240]